MGVCLYLICLPHGSYKYIYLKDNFVTYFIPFTY